MPGEGELQQQQLHQPQVIHVNQNQDMNVQIQNDSLMLQQNMQVQNTQVQQNQQLQENTSDQLQEDVMQNMPQQLTGNVEAPEESELPRSLENIEGINTLYGEFSKIEERDSEKMKAIKIAFIKYARETKGENQNLLTDIYNLDNLISACRWYNATRWSLRSNARERQRKVKVILEAAKKERARIAKLDKERSKSDLIETRRRADEKTDRIYEEGNKEGGLILRQYNTDLTDNIPAGGSFAWAKFKACTFGLIGRNILNIGMGAIAGAAWLGTYPLAVMVGAYGSLAGNQDLKKYYKGFNIKIPRPMSPKGWYEYYLHHQKHAVSAAARVQMDGGKIGKQIQEFILRFFQYNLWHPIKHILTLDMKHLSGNGYFEPHEKDKRKKMEEMAKAELRGEQLGFDEDDEDDGDDE